MTTTTKRKRNTIGPTDKVDLITYKYRTFVCRKTRVDSFGEPTKSLTNVLSLFCYTRNCDNDSILILMSCLHWRGEDPFVVVVCQLSELCILLPGCIMFPPFIILREGGFLPDSISIFIFFCNQFLFHKNMYI